MKNNQLPYCFLLALAMLISYQSLTQATINKNNSIPDVSAMLDIKSTESGLLIPRMSQQQRANITEPAKGLMLFQNDVAAGFYYNAGSPQSPNWSMAAGEGAIYDSRIPLDSVCASCINDGFEITSPGSYYLTRDLETSDGGATVIEIKSDNVSLDLNGFTISNTGTNSSFGTGISATARDNILIENGRVKGFRGDGIITLIARNCTFRNLIVTDNSFDGINADDFSTISNVIFSNNGESGVVVGDYSIVTDCTAEGNGNEGFRLGTGSQLFNSTATANNEEGIVGAANGVLVDGCTASDNVEIGISLRGSGSIVRNCVSTENGEYGIRVVSGTVVNCNVTDNGSCVSSNTCTPSLGNSSSRNCPEGTGICGVSRSHIYNNHSNDNVIGIFLVSYDGLTFNNYCEGNSHQGIVGIPRNASGTTSGAMHTRNVCHNNGNSSNATIAGLGIPAGEYYFTGADISYGPIVNIMGVGNILGTTNADHPLANFEF